MSGIVLIYGNLGFLAVFPCPRFKCSEMIIKLKLNKQTNKKNPHPHVSPQLVNKGICSPSELSADHIKNPRKKCLPFKTFAMMKKEDKKKTDVPLFSLEEAQSVPLKMTMPCFVE